MEEKITLIKIEEKERNRKISLSSFVMIVSIYSAIGVVYIGEKIFSLVTCNGVLSCQFVRLATISYLIIYTLIIYIVFNLLFHLIVPKYKKIKKEVQDGSRKKRTRDREKRN